MFTDPSAMRQTEQWNQAWANDGRCHVAFHKMTVLDERATHGHTEERQVQNDDGSMRLEIKRFPGAGRPIFREAVYVKKFTPGDPTNIVDREVREEDKLEFAQEWARFEKGNGGDVSGSPLELLPGLNAARVEEFKHFPRAPVRTIEELANLNDNSAQSFMCYAERDRARAWLQAMKEQAPRMEQQALLAEVQQLREELAAVKAAAAKPEALMAKPPVVRRRPGRPRKTETPETAAE